MESTGKLLNCTRDILSGKLNVTFQIDTEPIDEINELGRTSDVLDIIAKKHKKKRSLDANAYCWVLLTKIANHKDIRSSKEEVYEDMLQKYGYLDQDEDGYIVITIKKGIDVKRLGGHWKFYKSNGKFDSYLALKGSSEYTTAQMASFIDSIVYECKLLGIETMTPDEIKRMVEAWQKA